MNRPIEFRAWDNEYKEMRKYPFSISQDGLIFWVNSTGALDGFFDKTEYTPYYPPSYRFELMQYTGRKDKNGKKIFESDIIKYGATVAIVEWLDCSFIRRVNNNMYHNFHVKDEIEIIGNIYENSYLLKDKS